MSMCETINSNIEKMQLFKRREILSKKEMKRAKRTLGIAAAIMSIQFVTAAVTEFMYEGKNYE